MDRPIFRATGGSANVGGDSADPKLVMEFSSDALRTDSLNTEDKMKRTLVIPALLLLAASAAAQTAPAPTKNPVSTALRDILPAGRRTP